MACGAFPLGDDLLVPDADVWLGSITTRSLSGKLAVNFQSWTPSQLGLDRNVDP